MIPFGSGLRTDSAMIRYDRHWGRLKRALLARLSMINFHYASTTQ
ncbi:hypothetical protein [Desulforamulus hydrothermalis]|nr:hypothetical protein [Desulforamulus hydrothermalis]